MTTLQIPVLVIGSGISGLFTVLKLAEAGIRVLLMTKSQLAENNSRYAQGGIAAVLPDNLDDSLELHVQDTLRAGAGLCDEVAVRSILAEGCLAIDDLLRFGVPFDRNQDNRLAMTQEAAHSVRRIVHAGGDATGHSVEMALIQQCLKHPSIQVLEYCQAVELKIQDGRCTGCLAVNLETQEVFNVSSAYTVLATGGIGRLYRQTTNPTIATGDGIALARRAGALLKDMEFVQFHPTAFYHEGRVRFLISEALRGEGGYLFSPEGERFAARYHPDAELAPRDVVTRAIFSEMQQHQAPCVYLDISHLPQETIERRFPNILANCLRFGVDIRRERIPVAPAAHYMMGGVAVDLWSRTKVPGLYAVGEVGCSGLHGANRLASNSLLECVVMGRRAAEHIASQGPFRSAVPRVTFDTAPVETPEVQFEIDPEILVRQEQLYQLMWDAVGIVRTTEGLRQSRVQIFSWQQELVERGWQRQLPNGLEYANLLLVGEAIARAALAREDSTGAHFRLPEPPVLTSALEQSTLL